MRHLRVLNGIKRGAVLPLNIPKITIGSSLENDLVLIDPGINEHHLKIEIINPENISDHKSNNIAYILSPLNESCLNFKGKKQQHSIKIYKDNYFHINNIWMTIHDEDDIWPEEIPNEIKNNSSESKWNKFLDKKILFFLILIIPLFFIYFLSGVNNKIDSNENINVINSVDGKLDSDLHELQSRFNLIKKNEFDNSDLSHENDVDVDIDNEIKKIYRMLTLREIHKIKVSFINDEIQLDGVITEPEKDKIIRFVDRYNNISKKDKTLIDKTIIKENELPFKIVSITSGPYSHVSLANGDKIHVGQKYKGFLLKAITPKMILFYGEKEIKINW